MNGTTTTSSSIINSEEWKPWNDALSWTLTIIVLYMWNLVLSCLNPIRMEALDTFQAQCSSCNNPHSLDPPLYYSLVLAQPPPSYKQALAMTPQPLPS